MDLLFEEYTVKKEIMKTKRGPKNIVVLQVPDGVDTKSLFGLASKFDAKWDYKNKRILWYLSDDERAFKNDFEKKVKPYLDKVNSGNDSKEAVMNSLDDILAGVEKVQVNRQDEKLDDALTAQEKNELLDKIENLKKELLNIEDSEEFKNRLKSMVSIKSFEGHRLSFSNSILVNLQAPGATLVKSVSRWNLANKFVKLGANPIYIWSPAQDRMTQYSDEEKELLSKGFLHRVGKKSIDDLNVSEKERLHVILRGSFRGGKYDMTAVYDIKDTGQMSDMPVLIDDIEKVYKAEWFMDGETSEKVRPIYNSLIKFATEEIKVKVIQSEKPGGGTARGVSSNGRIDILPSEGNDVGITKTLAHEIMHEILHQTYQKDKQSDYAKFFVGRDEGRAALEQQAEISAYIIMQCFGFDVKTTSFNYIIMWGSNNNNMVKVFDVITGAVNMLVMYINKEIGNNQNIGEDEGSEVLPKGKMISPMDVAKAVGVSSKYQQIKQKEQMHEQFFKLINKKVI